MPNWKITNLKKLASVTDGANNTKQNVIQQIDASYISDESEVLHNSVVAISHIDLSNFTEYDDLTEDMCIEWVRTILEETGELSKIENPSTVSNDVEMSDGLPW